MHLKRILAVSVAIFFSNVPAAGADALCERVRDINVACAQTEHGIALGPTQSDVESLAAALGRPEAAFERYFEVPPPLYAIAVGADARAHSGDLRARGFAVFADATPAERRDAMAASIRNGMTARLRESGLSESEIEAQIQSAIARQTSQLQNRGIAVAAHELGHVWFKKVFSSDQTVAQDRYGSTLPDWLDETAAVLMEDDELTRSRNAHFASRYAGENIEQVSLEEFFTREHPIHRQARALAAEGGRVSNGGPRILSGEEARAAGIDINNAAAFYSMTRAVADYFVERSGNPGIFAELARSAADGETMQAWLARRGDALGLPTTLSAFETDWRVWARARISVAQTGSPG